MFYRSSNIAQLLTQKSSACCGSQRSRYHAAATTQAGTCRAASEKGAEEEAERQLAAVKKLKAEVTRKEGMLKATQSELDKVQQPFTTPLSPDVSTGCPSTTK